MRRMTAAIAAMAMAMAAGLAASSAAACGVETDCALGDRAYRVYVPEGLGDGPIGAVVYAHGYKGSARGVISNPRLRGVADRLGVALVAGGSAGDDWLLPGTPKDPAYRGRAELEYFAAVLADVEARFGVDPARTLMTGFSAGGMMVWNLACDAGALFAAYAPIAGTFWEPVPARCSSAPVSLLHIHGDADRTVPLGGRRIAQTKQGDVRAALAMYGAHGGFGPPREEAWDEMRCVRRDNASGQLLDFCLFEGGHSFRAGYVERAWRYFETRGVL